MEDEEGRLSMVRQGARKARESIQEQWTKCDEAFQHLKRSLIEALVLAYAEPAKPYELHVDASREELGIVLYQEQDGGLKPIAYVSHSLTLSEKNYLVYKLEFLALSWAVIDKLRDYLYWSTFVVKMENNPLTYLLSSAKLDATRNRWLAVLLGFQFSLKYRPGTRNRDTVLKTSPIHQGVRRLNLCDS